MTVRVQIKSGCNGMGACVRMVPDVFRIDQKTGKAIVRDGNLEPYRERLLKVRDQCPFVSVQVGKEKKEETFEPVTIAGITYLTADVIELRLNRPRYPFTPGQYAFVQMNDAEGEFFRSYSVVSADQQTVTFCVKVLSTGRGGKVLRALKPGDRVGLGRAMGMFALSSYTRPKLFITGGTGIAPVIPMCRAAPLAAKTVIFGVRTEADLFWIEELENIPGTTVIPVVESPIGSWKGMTGRVTNVLQSLPVKDFSEFYACGNPKMILAAREHLLGQGIQNTCIYSDSFDATVLPTDDPVIREETTSVPQKFSWDWQMVTRRLHFYASLGLAGLILFYACTGFIANRVNLFVEEGDGAISAPTVGIPSSVAMTSDGLCAYLSRAVPAQAQKKSYTETEEAIEIVFAVPAKDRCPACEITATVHRSDRSVVMLKQQSIPLGIGLDADSLTAYFLTQLSGEPDLKHREDDATALSIDLGSVWGVHAIQADKVKRQWQVATTQPAFAVAVIDLHRGKHAGFIQKILVDITAFLLGFVTLSGVAMGLGSAARTRRFVAAVLIGGSLLMVIGLIVAR